MSFECDICPKTFSVKRSLIRHVDSRHKKIKVFCMHCHKAFSRSDSLAHHINTMHPVKMERKAPGEPKRRQKKTVKVMREQVRVKRERKRILPPTPVELPVFPAIEEYSPPPTPAHVEVLHRVLPQEPPSTPKAARLDSTPEELPSSVEIKTELQVEVEPCIVINGEEEFGGTTKSEMLDDVPVFPSTRHSPDKQKRFTAADELDYTVLDMMQQSAIDAKDEDRMFLLSILSDFKRVPLEKKLKVKARIVGAIVDALD